MPMVVRACRVYLKYITYHNSKVRRQPDKVRNYGITPPTATAPPVITFLFAQINTRFDCIMLKMPLENKKSPFQLRNELFSICGISWNRTSDTRIFSPLLYQLSYDTAALGLQM
jgi:hypothetical protein